MRVYWFRRRRNFGDALVPILLRRFSGLGARWAHPALSDAVVIGSFAARLPRLYYGVVAGIGKFNDRDSPDLSRANVLGLRGELTLRGSRVRGDPVLGDPGLLAAQLLDKRPAISHRLGVVPHYNDTTLVTRYPDAHYIDVTLDPVEVIRQIAACDRVICSSLHSLIAADSLGIPRRWEPSPLVKGGPFKFHDYATALGMVLVPDKWDTAPAAAVETVVARLRDVFREIPAAVAAERSRPLHRLAQSVDSTRGWLFKHARL